MNLQISGLENIAGALLETYKQLDPSTIQHAHEIMNEKRTNKDLRDQCIITADHSMYAVEDDEEFLYFSGRENNLIFQNIEEAVKQLKETDNYKPTREGIEQVIESAKAGNTLKVKISDLKLVTINNEYGYFKIDTKNYDKLNPEQRKLAERVYGEGEDFIENMKMLNDSGIGMAMVYVLTPKYVKQHAKENPISRPSWLNGFGYDSSFNTNGGDVKSGYNFLRGVRLKSVD